MKHFAWLLGVVVLASSMTVGYVGYTFLQNEGFKDAEFDRHAPEVRLPKGKVRVLLFSKTNGFRHPSIDQAVAAFGELAKVHDWSFFTTENGAVHAPELLDQFDVVVWNNVTGDVLLPGQRSALQLWIEQGGRFFGIHGTGGNRNYSWDWRSSHMIGARFKGHTLFPRTRTGLLRYENHLHPIVKGIPEQWKWEDEWFSFQSSPRNAGAQVIFTVDESSYSPFEYLQMGGDHPVVWYQAVKNGVTLYSALGHRPESWEDELFLRFIANSVNWLSSPRSSPVGPPPERPDAEAEAPLP